VQSSQGADLFIGYGGVIERSAVAEAAEWYVYDHDELTRALKQSKVGPVWARRGQVLLGKTKHMHKKLSKAGGAWLVAKCSTWHALECGQCMAGPA